MEQKSLKPTMIQSPEDEELAMECKSINAQIYCARVNLLQMAYQMEGPKGFDAVMKAARAMDYFCEGTAKAVYETAGSA